MSDLEIQTLLQPQSILRNARKYELDVVILLVWKKKLPLLLWKISRKIMEKLKESNKN